MRLAIVSLLLFVASTAFCQDKPIPEYLTKNDFPDSVKSIGMQTPEGSRLTFGDMLETYKGKKVVIDIWASWCRDCIVGYPKLEKLRQEVGEENVVYVFLSTDKDVNKWKNAITGFQIRGQHYLLNGAWNKTLSSYIVLDWVPRYLVLNEKGMVIMPKAIHADDPALRTMLIE
jgi:thiol-disulfide isomerase/thioredoxin